MFEGFGTDYVKHHEITERLDKLEELVKELLLYVKNRGYEAVDLGQIPNKGGD